MLANCTMDTLHELELSKGMARKSSESIKDFEQICKMNVMIPATRKWWVEQNIGQDLHRYIKLAH